MYKCKHSARLLYTHDLYMGENGVGPEFRQVRGRESHTTEHAVSAIFIRGSQTVQDNFRWIFNYLF